MCSSIFAVFKYALVILWIFQGLVSSSTLKIVPHVTILKKYIGESVNLTCVLHEDQEVSHVSYLGKSDEPPSTLNWILPTNNEGRVMVRESRNAVSLFLANLTESDHGNYTCSLHSNNTVNAARKISLMLAVLARNSISTCTEDSFHCQQGVCVSKRYMCDGVSDCPSGFDEIKQFCGDDPCSGKIKCSDGRCLDPQQCCRDPRKSPNNCSIHSSIRCCRQLIHLALLDQDLFYLASRPNNGEYNLYNFSFKVGSIITGVVVFMSCILFIAFIMLSYSFRYYPSFERSQMGMGVFDDSFFSRRNRGLRADSSGQRVDGTFLEQSDLFRSSRLPSILNPGALQSDRRERGPSSVILMPLNNVDLAFSECAPPPSYQQVIGAPPPPYSICSESGTQAADDISPTLPTISALSPGLSCSNSSISVNGLQNNNYNTRTLNRNENTSND